MIIVQLIGGLGNQMFQFATAFALAKKTNQQLKLDASRITANNETAPHIERRFFSLFNFNIPLVRCLNQLELLALRVIFYLKRRNYNLYNIDIYEEKQFFFDANLLEIKNSVYLIGYFQSENYFYHYRNELIKAFRLRAPLDIINADLASKISISNAVSIHIRRGDYITNDEIKLVHGTCSLEYYKNAINHIKNKVESPFFFIFSDDIHWAKENLQFCYPSEFISHNSNIDSYKDLHLMTLCKHNIIANSSFSWWGAWLNENPGKIVIAPSIWYNDEIKNLQTKDLIPDNWIRI